MNTKSRAVKAVMKFDTAETFSRLGVAMDLLLKVSKDFPKELETNHEFCHGPKSQSDSKIKNQIA